MKKLIQITIMLLVSLFIINGANAADGQCKEGATGTDCGKCIANTDQYSSITTSEQATVNAMCNSRCITAQGTNNYTSAHCTDQTWNGSVTLTSSQRANLVEDNALVVAMCRLLNVVTGTGGKAFAAFAVISVGIGFFTGKVSWGLMISVAMGIAAIFGAASIVAAISGEEAANCGDYRNKGLVS